MKREVLLALALGAGAAAAQSGPAGWTATEITLARCGASTPAFEFVTEWRDERRRVRELRFSRRSLLDAYSDLTLAYNVAGRLREVRWNVTGDWDYGQLTWELGSQENVISVREAGRRDGLPYARQLPPARYPVPDAYRLPPVLDAYQRLACTDVSWPTR